MIYFDSESIYRRLLSRIQQNPDWNVISNNSVINAILKNTAETTAETARYTEYLFKESKWDTAQNMSSILSMANMLGYQPRRKTSARGAILVSIDPKIQQVGNGIPLSYITNEENKYLAKTTADIVIGKNCTVVDNLGNNYLVSSKKINKDRSYDTLEIVQGVKKSVNLSISSIRTLATSSKLDPYLYIPLKIKNCEAAKSPLTRSFFKVIVNSTFGDTVSSQEYRIVDSLLFSNKQDYDVEVYNDLYSQEVFYLKFNNDSTRGKVLDISKNSSISSITVEYIETAGAAGNLPTKFNTFMIKGATYTKDSTVHSITLYGVNTLPITGGRDEETVGEIKENAPKYYISNYTAGTKEAYERTIANIELKVNLGNEASYIINPTKVQVYGGNSVVNGENQRVTKISFLAANLIDLIERGNQLSLDDKLEDKDKGINKAVTAIEEALTFYLSKLKSPQDTLKFEAPTYVPFALGINCRVKKDSTVDLGELEQNISTYVENLWGEASSSLDFNRSFYPSSITTDIMRSYPDIVSIDTSVEAVQKLNWVNAERVEGGLPTANQTILEHVVRVPFSFDNIFLGKQAIKGFKDFKSGSSYVARVDILYKKPSAMTSDYKDISWFIRDTSNRQVYQEKTSGSGEFELHTMTTTNESEQRSFICRKVGLNSSNLWDPKLLKEQRNYDLSKRAVLGFSNTDNSVSSLMIPYQTEIFTENTFNNLVQDVENNVIQTLYPSEENVGACNMFFECNTNFNVVNTDSSFITGYVEVDFDSIFRVLNKFSLYNTELFNKLNKISCSSLKCDASTSNTQIQEDFKTFKSIIMNYMDIYVSFRPVDTDLVLGVSSNDAAGRVLQIDSYDGENDSDTTNINLSSLKRSRMISIKCKYEE